MAAARDTRRGLAGATPAVTQQLASLVASGAESSLRSTSCCGRQSARELQRGRGLGTFDVELPPNLRALLNPQHWSRQTAVDDGRSAYGDPTRCDDRTGDMTADDDRVGLQVAVDLTRIVDGQRMAGDGDRAVDATSNRERFVSGDVAGDGNGLTDNRRCL